MVTELTRKCPKCNKEHRWSYSGAYRAYYCDTCKQTRLEIWNDHKNIWEEIAPNEL